MIKTWKYIYIDQIKIEVVDGQTFLTATNRELFQNKPITYNVPDGVCYIHSDDVIEGLTLFLTDSEMIQNRRE